MKVKNMVSASGKKVANQFVITGQSENGLIEYETFQSYESVIVKVSTIKNNQLCDEVVELDAKYYKHSITTINYRNQFLNETSKEINKKISDGTYFLTNLN